MPVIIQKCCEPNKVFCFFIFSREVTAKGLKSLKPCEWNNFYKTIAGIKIKYNLKTQKQKEQAAKKREI